MWTVSRLANFATAAFNLSAADKTRWFRTIRNFVDKNIVVSKVDEFDQRGTRHLDDNAAAIALLLAPLSILGTDARGLRQVAKDLEGEIAVVLDAIRADKAVRVVNVLRSRSGKLKAVIWVEIEGGELKGKAAELKAADSITKVDFARIEVDATAILKAFVA